MQYQDATTMSQRDTSRPASSESDPRGTAIRYRQTLIGVHALQGMVPPEHVRQTKLGIPTPLPMPLSVNDGSESVPRSSDSAQLRDRLREQQAQISFAEAVLEELSGVITAEPNGNIYYCDSEACKLFGVHEAEMRSTTVQDLLRVSLNDDGDFMRRFQRGTESARDVPMYLAHRDGSGTLVRLSLKYVSNAHTGERSALFLRVQDDVENRTDPRTGILNLFEFQRRLKDEEGRLQRGQLSKGLSLMIFDLDHFKRVNDTHGHPAGDQVLREVSQAIAGAVRHLDTVARIGGEEIGVLMPNSDLDAALQRAETIRQIVESLTIQYEDKVISVTTSIGVATVTTEDVAVLADGERQQLSTRLYARADAALYVAKHSGRNRVSIAA